MFSIHPLAEHREWAAPLAAWHYQQWGPLLPWWTPDAALAELECHAQGGAYPTTMVAVRDDVELSPSCERSRLLGSVSLVADDLVELPQYEPWLASLFVLPEHRGRGVATTLVRFCERAATGLGFTCLHLFTAGQQAFYDRLGWVVVETLDYYGHPGVIMRTLLAPNSVREDRRHE